LAVLHSSCCGIDVHQKSISACVLTVDGAGKLTSEVRQFGTTTHELRALNDWLAQCAVTHVAMESTGVYWKPIFNLLEGQVEVVLANAAHLEERARQEDRHCRLCLDRDSSPAWANQGQLRASAADPRVA
jgi:transposase